jgi:hypothetical protein
MWRRQLEFEEIASPGILHVMTQASATAELFGIDT